MKLTHIQPFMVLKQFSKLVEVELVDRPLVPVIRNPSYPRTSVHCIRPDFEPSDHSSKLELGIFSKYPMHWLSSCICGAFLHSHASSQRWKFSRKLTPTLVSMSCVSRLGLAVGLWEWVVRFNYRRTLRCVIAKKPRSEALDVASIHRLPF